MVCDCHAWIPSPMEFFNSQCIKVSKEFLNHDFKILVCLLLGESLRWDFKSHVCACCLYHFLYWTLKLKKKIKKVKYVCRVRKAPFQGQCLLKRKTMVQKRKHHHHHEQQQHNTVLLEPKNAVVCLIGYSLLRTIQTKFSSSFHNEFWMYLRAFFIFE